MSKKQTTFRKRRLFPRTVEEVVKEATKPLMREQGKLYGALLRDWGRIMGDARAKICKPERLQFPTNDASGATLHILARPAMAPELTYETEQMLEQCARYFGYRAVTRIVIHASHEAFSDEPMPAAKPTQAKPSAPAQSPSIPDDMPETMRGILERIGRHVSTSDKKN